VLYSRCQAHGLILKGGHPNARVGTAQNVQTALLNLPQTLYATADGQVCARVHGFTSSCQVNETDGPTSHTLPKPRVLAQDPHCKRNPSTTSSKA